jgi:hypothetical protein
MSKWRTASCACAGALIGFSLVACVGARQSAEPYVGSPARRTPYDSRYERVRLYLEEARTKIMYTPEEGGRDYWQLPEESEYLGAGDCEDMAIWLYVKMKRAGLRPLRLCIGKHCDTAAQMHAWVLWQDGKRLYILDPSTSAEPMRLEQISPDSYVPYYSYDGDRKWRHKAAG